jgi:cytoskeletal protein CcmA (bactofilin family)
MTEFVIGLGSEMEGTVSSSAMIRVEGKCKGSLRSSSEIIIARGAEMEGDLTAGSVVLAGSMRGNIVSHGLVTLCAQARLTGDIRAPFFRMEQGAFFDGNIIRTVG